MRLLFINERLSYSSTTSYSYDLVRVLKERGNQVRLCTGGGDLREAFRREGIETYLVRYNYFSFRKLTHLLHEYRPEIVHSLNLRSMPMALKIAQRLQKPLVATVHHIPSEQTPTVPLRHISGVIAVNEAVREALVNTQRVPKEIIRVVRSGVSVEKFVPGSPPLSAPNRIPVIGSIGRMTRVKGYTYLITAARRVLDSGREAMFVIHGDGDEERNLRRQIRELELEQHVHLCPPLPRLPELLRNLDIVVVPTLRGGVGLTALEAMAMARPVVASAVGEILQIITDEETGLLVNERDPDALAGAIIRLLENPEEARELGRRAREWVEKNLALSPMVDATEAFFREVIEEGVGAAR